MTAFLKEVLGERVEKVSGRPEVPRGEARSGPGALERGLDTPADGSPPPQQRDRSLPGRWWCRRAWWTRPAP